jgi:hypothetical protein
MASRQETKSGQQDETYVAQSEIVGSTKSETPGPVTFAQSVLMTIKILAVFGLLGVALWAINLWIVVK